MTPRLASLVALIFLFCYSYFDPVSELNLSKYEGEDKALYFVKIVNRTGDSYIVETFFGENAVVRTKEELEIGKIFSFYGGIERGELIVEKMRIHLNPYVNYYTSFIGLLVFLWILRRD
jgi:hypothetical protein